ncbi:MORN repeat-containing protein [Planoprotostelium fungivorum]|uniref:MORN repeat-containing protein n=1 Tax=Planoprotostelium fungivorum TaxID=1890364 RepID=A0A2P6NGX2_9EUKA|nr:MORN repeat-containing protein [Planoprotostelium fungivorum]
MKTLAHFEDDFQHKFRKLTDAVETSEESALDDVTSLVIHSHTLQEDDLDVVPEEIREMIFDELILSGDWRSVVQASRVNLRWKNLIDFLWRRYATRNRLILDEQLWTSLGRDWKWLTACVTKDQFKIGFGRTARLHTEAQYDGEFKDNLKHGIGRMSWFNGDRFIGHWASDCKNGHGTMMWENGDSYVGGWENDFRHGHSLYTYSNGGKFEGNYLNDERHGPGIYTWPDGDRYEGEWISGGRRGRGVFVKANGEREEQEWTESPYVSYSNALPPKEFVA